MNDDAKFELFCLDGKPMRRRYGGGQFQIYWRRGEWADYSSTKYAAEKAISLSAEAHSALVEAHDLAQRDREYDEAKWRREYEADEADVRHAAEDYDLSDAELESANFIAWRVKGLVERAITSKDRLRPRTAAVAVRAALAMVERWSRRPENVAFDRYLPPIQLEDRRNRIHICRRLAPGARRVFRSPEGAGIVLLAEGIETVRRFMGVPYTKAVSEFQERWVLIPEDSEEATAMSFDNAERNRAAVAAWKELTRAEEDLLIGLVISFGADHDRFEQALCGAGAW